MNQAAAVFSMNATCSWGQRRREGGREGRFGHLFLWMFVTVSTFFFFFSDSARDHGNGRKCSERNDAGADFTLSELS